MKIQHAILSIAAAALAVTMGADAPGAEERSSNLSPQALQEIAKVEAETDLIEAQAIERLAAPPDNQIQKIELLGKLMLYDKDLSINRNEACAFCHMPETGFTGPVSELNRTTGAYPGSVRTRFSDRKPQSHAYAPLSPVLHYNPGSLGLSDAEDALVLFMQTLTDGLCTNRILMGQPLLAFFISAKRHISSLR